MTFDIPAARAMLGSVKGKDALDLGAKGDSAFFILRNFQTVLAVEPDEKECELLAGLEKIRKSWEGEIKRVLVLKRAATSIDALVKEFWPFQLIKIDIESRAYGEEREFALLETAEETIKNHAPSFYYEYESEKSLRLATQFFLKHGYETLEIERSNRHGWILARYPLIPLSTKVRIYLRLIIRNAVHKRVRHNG